MNLYLIISAFLNVAGAAVIGVSVFAAGRSNPRNMRFLVFLVTVALWSASYFAWRLSSDPRWALFFAKLLMMFAVFIPVTLTHFICRLTDLPRPFVVFGGYAIAAILALLCFGDGIVASLALTENYGLWPKAGRLFAVALLVFGFYTVFPWFLIWKRAKTETGDSKRQLRYILTALIVGFIGGSTNFPLWYDIPLPPVGNGLVLLYMAMMAHAITKYRLPEVSIDLVRGVVYAGVAITFSIFFLLAVSAFYYATGQPLSGLDFFTYFLVALLVTAFFLWSAPRLRKFSDGLIEHTLFRARYSHRQSLRELPSRVFSFDDEQAIFGETIRVVSAALDVDRAAIYFQKELGSGYELRDSWGFPSGHEGPPRFIATDHIFPRILRRVGAIFLLHAEDPLPVGWAKEMWTARKIFDFVEAIVPIDGHKILLGFLVLGHPKREGYYNELDLSLVETCCLQAGLAVRSRQFERRANQTEKLISIGTLAAGLAHELRNPLVSIKTFTSLLGEFRKDPESMAEMSEVVERDVNRIAAIIENVAAFAQNDEIVLNNVDLRTIMQSVAQICRSECDLKKITLKWPEDKSISVHGNFAQLQQVFLNLIQNAIQALDKRPDPTITVNWWESAGNGGTRAHWVEVADNGAGIVPEFKERIFEPFVTTKDTGDGTEGQHRGMGLGLAIVRRIIDGHHGTITVESEPGVGTRFQICFSSQPR